ncbi:MAG: SDR family oxidoreductase, partial [Desulfobulbaceae bacterium]|nr:SDR family oxidoreductase [Desulfobulbaceae bacterium]
IFPHRLSKLCALVGARLIHISTDCVFSGKKGMYSEEDFPDANDLYGRTKLLGEVDYPNALTLRTSMIGHEITGSKSLISWFLAQKGPVKGYRRAVFSGLPTVEIARVILDFVLPNAELHGVYHLSAAPIDKYDLLSRVAMVYGKSIEIVPDDSVQINRSLDSSRFRAVTGFNPKSWDEMIIAMRDFG